MSRYLAYTSPARGHLYPIVPMLGELRDRGHEVIARTLASEVGPLADLGIAAAPIDPAIEAIEHEDWRARTPIGGLKRSIRTFADRAGHDLADCQRAIAEEEPDSLSRSGRATPEKRSARRSRSSRACAMRARRSPGRDPRSPRTSPASDSSEPAAPLGGARRVPRTRTPRAETSAARLNSSPDMTAARRETHRACSSRRDVL